MWPPCPGKRCHWCSNTSTAGSCTTQPVRLVITALANCGFLGNPLPPDTVSICSDFLPLPNLLSLLVEFKDFTRIFLSSQVFNDPSERIGYTRKEDLKAWVTLWKLLFHYFMHTHPPPFLDHQLFLYQDPWTSLSSHLWFPSVRFYSWAREMAWLVRALAMNTSWHVLKSSVSLNKDLGMAAHVHNLSDGKDTWTPKLHELAILDKHCTPSSVRDLAQN